MRPSFDHPNQQGPISLPSGLLRIRIMFGWSPLGIFGILQTLRFPSAVCVASMSDFCLVADPCHASPVTREGAFEVLSEWTIVKGCRVATRIEPLRYLETSGSGHVSKSPSYSPNGKCLIIWDWCKCCDGVVYRSSRHVLGCRRFEDYDIALDIACESISNQSRLLQSR